MTAIQDLENDAEVWKFILELCQDIGHRLYIFNKKATGIAIAIRDNELFTKQANVVAFCLLLRPHLVGWAVYTFTHKETITVYGGNVLFKEDRSAIRMMAQYLGVSQECLRYRLDRLGYLDHKPISEYDPVMDIYLPWR